MSIVASNQSTSSAGTAANPARSPLLPSIAPPKGGGAFRSVAEKFAANPATGSGSVQIPLPVSPGRAGFAPSLALGYDSSGGNGPFGFGWALSLPRIARRTAKGVPLYDESDVYVLSGAEDLVPVLEGDQCLQEPDLHPDFSVRRYMPRVEAGFARIECWTHRATQDVHWRSISRENATTIYGRDSTSRIVDPDDPSRVFAWLICESRDDRGNAMIFDYVHESAAGADPSDSRDHRAQIYLKRVRYGNLVSTLIEPDLSHATWLFEVVLDYGEDHLFDVIRHEGQGSADASAVPRRDWNMRSDPFSDCRAGFEIRTHRRCQRVLMFHCFQELGPDPCLVASTEFDYRDGDPHGSGPLGAFLMAVSQSGYIRQPDGSYRSESLPPTTFDYSRARLSDEVRTLDRSSLENLPAGIGGDIHWVDLDGNGLPGMLARKAGAWLYKPNLGEGRFGPAEILPRQPSAAPEPGTEHFMDLSGDGELDLVMLHGALPGFYERAGRTWLGFRTIPALPRIEWTDPGLRFVDLTGDGLADVLVTQDRGFEVWQSQGEDGFAPGRIVHHQGGADRPDVAFTGDGNNLHLADMTGDGLTDLVRIGNGQVDYWPSLGHGRFGPRVSMADAPWLSAPDLLDRRRLLLADIDGSGTTDLIWLDETGAHVWFNQAGNGWSAPHHLPSVPPVSQLDHIAAADLLGNGTACLVWSTPLPGGALGPLRYIDLMGGQKPHLLTFSTNNLGVETRVYYAPSTRFYSADRAAGQPWIGHLPFPVHVVERIETVDCVSKNRFVTRYSYRHGCFDGIEREFRGFARVDQIDTQEFAALAGDSDALNCDHYSHVPEVLTRSFYHTGIALKAQLSREFFCEPGPCAAHLPGSELPSGLSPGELREARRALKGALLRQEVYALDGGARSDLPYAVTERCHAVRLLQPQGPNPYGAFLTLPSQEVQIHYDRASVRVKDGLITPHDPDSREVLDPRISHSIALETDRFGNRLKAVSIGYGRRHADPNLPPEVQAMQARCSVILSDIRMTDAVDLPDAWRTPVAYDTRSLDLTGFAPTGPDGRFRADDFGRLTPQGFVLDGRDIAPEAQPGADRQRRLLNRSVAIFRCDDLHGPLPPGQTGPRAIPEESYTLVYSDGLLDRLFGDRITSRMMSEAGYVRREDAWWNPSGRVFFAENDDPAAERRAAQANFFTPCRARDPFGAESLIRYDRYHLLGLETVNALGHRITAGERGPAPDAPVDRTGLDYRMLAPRLVMDANRNRVETAFDALGRVSASARMGKPEEALGDRLPGTFQPIPSPAELKDMLTDPDAAAPGLLGAATMRLIHDTWAFLRNGQPVTVVTLTRDLHESDVLPGARSPVHARFAFHDGFGRGIQNKVLAEPEDGHTRWTCTGWTVFNNKGDPVRQFEPFFTDTHRFEFDARHGVSPIQFYDAMSRSIGTLQPDQCWSRSDLGPWASAVWDPGDTILLDPLTDPTLGDHFARLPHTIFRPGWHAARIDGDLGKAEAEAARDAELAAATPMRVHSDALGRAVWTVQHNRFPMRDDWAEEFPSSLVRLDATGKQTEQVDAMGRIVTRYGYDLSGVRVTTSSMEAGRRWSLADVSGKPAFAWDDRGHRIRIGHDALRRPVQTWLQKDDQPEILVGVTGYGEDAAKNSIGRLVETHDQAGIARSLDHDFKGNVLRSSRQFACTFDSLLDWQTDIALLPQCHISRSRFDAQDRPVQIVPPRAAEARGQIVIQPVYNAANLLQRLDVWLDHAPPDRLLEPATDPPDPVGIVALRHNARGQRQRVEYANGVASDYGYDPLTFRLRHLRSVRSTPGNTDILQDFTYVYDPGGNIAHVADNASSEVFFRNGRVSGDCGYRYDALGRLIRATGREHLGQSGFGTPWGDSDADRMNLPGPQDAAAVGGYAESYGYDLAGNIVEMRHRNAAAPGAGWTRRFLHDEASQIEPDRTSNRLTATITGEVLARTGGYDAHGNMLGLPHLAEMEWDHHDRLRMSRRQHGKGCDGRSFYVYDAQGQRVRKVTTDTAGKIREERFYLGGIEIYRRGGTHPVVRETLHVMDDMHRATLVETRLSGDEAGPAREIRFQIGDHLDHSRIELDERGRTVSIEEYSPWRSTAWQAVRSQTQVSKRWRAGQERDDETGFYYHGARYYAPWLCRWVSCDPAGTADGMNLYQYAADNPVNLNDPGGMQGEEAPWKLGDLIVYDDAVAGKAALGQNIQKDHAISQKIIRTILGPFEKLYKAGRDLTTIVETGAATGTQAARWHTVKSTLEKAIQATVSNKAALAQEISLADDVILPVERVLLQASNAQKLTRAQYLGMLSQLGNMHVLTLQQTAKLIPIINAGDEVKLTAEIDKLAKSRKGAVAVMRMMRGIAQSEKAIRVATTAASWFQKAGAALGTAGKVVAPVAKALAPVAKFAGKAAGPLGLGVGLAQVAFGKTTEDKIDGGITAVSSALMMSPHPVAKAAGGGLMAGQIIDKATGASDVSSSFGIGVKEKLESWGVNEDVAFVTGGVATVASIPVAIPVGAAKEVHKRLTSDEYTLVPWKSQIWADVFD